jgi:hypothetical protein
MALSWKLVIDSANAAAIADFWAAALEYEVEDPSALIGQLLAAGHIDADAVVEHRGRKTFRGYAGTRRALVDHAGPRGERVLRGVGARRAGAGVASREFVERTLDGVIPAMDTRRTAPPQAYGLGRRLRDHPVAQQGGQAASRGGESPPHGVIPARDARHAPAHTARSVPGAARTGE